MSKVIFCTTSQLNITCFSFSKIVKTHERTITILHYSHSLKVKFYLMAIKDKLDQEHIMQRQL